MQNNISDTLSRLPSDRCGKAERPNHTSIELAVVWVSELTKKVKDNLKNLQKGQELGNFCTSIKKELELPDSRERAKVWFLIHMGLLFKRGNIENSNARLCILKVHVPALVLREHKNNGHFGVAKCTNSLMRYFYSPKMRAYIRKIVSSFGYNQ